MTREGDRAMTSDINPEKVNADNDAYFNNAFCSNLNDMVKKKPWVKCAFINKTII